MARRNTTIWRWLVALSAALVGLTAAPAAGAAPPPAMPAPPPAGPATPAVGAEGAAGPARAAAPPTGPARAAAPLGRPGFGRTAPTESGYHHLGASTVGDWSGVLGRVTVRDPAVRRGTFDFVATRFMAKRYAGQRVSWLEAGWAETGWSGEGRQRVYTFDTNRNAWTFYDQYELRPGDDLWFYLHTDSAPGARPGAPALWQAWLWWRGDWHLLSAQELPLGPRTQLEQFVEVYVDPRHGGPGFPVPPVRVDNVQVKTDPRGELRYWRADVPSGVGQGRGRYCVAWDQPYDSWSAGDCPAAVAHRESSVASLAPSDSARATYQPQH